MYGRLPVLQIMRLPAANPVVQPGLAAGVSGFSRGLAQAMAMKQAAAKNALLNRQAQMAAMRAGYLPQQMADAHAQAVARNALLGAQTGYEGEMAQYLPELDNARMGLMGAQANEANTNAADMGKRLAIQQQQVNNSMARQSYYNSPPYIMAKVMDAIPASIRTVITANPVLAKKILGVISANLGSTTAAVPGSQSIPDSRIAGLAQTVQKMVRQSKLQADKESSSPAVQKQLGGAIQVEKMYHAPGFENQLKAAAPFMGPVGQLEAAGDYIKSLFGDVTPQYTAYTNLNNRLNYIGNRVRSMDAMPGLEAEVPVLQQMVNPAPGFLSRLFTSPQQFTANVNSQRNISGDVANAVRSSAQPVYNINPVLGGSDTAPRGSSGNVLKIGRFNVDKKFSLPKNTVYMENPEGQLVYVAASQKNDALKQGYKEVQ